MLKPGAKAPEFVLNNDEGVEIALSDPFTHRRAPAPTGGENCN